MLALWIEWLICFVGLSEIYFFLALYISPRDFFDNLEAMFFCKICAMLISCVTLLIFASWFFNPHTSPKFSVLWLLLIVPVSLLLLYGFFYINFLLGTKIVNKYLR